MTQIAIKAVLSFAKCSDTLQRVVHVGNKHTLNISNAS